MSKAYEVGKEWSGTSPHGLSIDRPTDRSYLCMGCVKLDDNIPCWDTEAMAQGPDWRQG